MYAQNVIKLSLLLKDRRGTPMDDAIWLIEFLARNKGADHLKISSRNLNVFEYYSLDSCLIILCMLLVVLSILYFLTSKIMFSFHLLFTKISDNFSSPDKMKVL